MKINIFGDSAFDDSKILFVDQIFEKYGYEGLLRWFSQHGRVLLPLDEP